MERLEGRHESISQCEEVGIVNLMKIIDDLGRIFLIKDGVP